MSRSGVPGLSLRRRIAVGGAAGAATLGFVLFLILAWSLWTYNGPGPKAKAGEETLVFLRPGAGLNEIASTLEREGAVRSAPIFAAAANFTGAGRELKAGEYSVASGASMAAVLEKVRKGEVVRRMVTIPEGVTSEMVVEILMNQPLLTGEVPTPPEGAILPETYEFQRGQERSAVLTRMMDARDELVAKLWAQRQAGLPYQNIEEAVILASIVEKETGVKTERPEVARAFVNRLQMGMRLESDPTIIYGLTKGRPLGRGILLSEKNRVTPYNTYFIDGLPPTPIANPGREALAAVMNPPPGNQLFFVADGTGGHVFAPSFEEHLRNVARYREIERARAQQKDAR